MTSSLRLALLAIAMLWIAPAGAQQPQEPPAFLQSLWPEAAKRGITRKTFDAAFAGFTLDQRVIATTTRQPEYNAAVGTYVNRMASATRIAGAAEKARTWKHTLDAIEKQYGVDRWILLSLWGIETSFGTNTGGFDVIRSLATLTQSQYRPDFFRDELFHALKILQDGHITRAKMVGSWAGAMGQPQFMPSNFGTLAADFDGDGRKDIWTSVPDVLASIANFLKHWGWKAGAPWGFEVIVPQGFDYRRSRASLCRMDGARHQARGRQGHSRERQRDPVLPEWRGGPGVSRGREFRGDQALQQFRCVRARGRAYLGSRARRCAVPRRVAGERSATLARASGWRCRGS